MSGGGSTELAKETSCLPSCLTPTPATLSSFEIFYDDTQTEGRCIDTFAQDTYVLRQVVPLRRRQQNLCTEFSATKNTFQVSHMKSIDTSLHNAVPEIDRTVPQNLQTATFALG